jgi:hypothetical protein
MFLISLAFISVSWLPYYIFQGTHELHSENNLCHGRPHNKLSKLDGCFAHSALSNTVFHGESQHTMRKSRVKVETDVASSQSTIRLTSAKITHSWKESYHATSVSLSVFANRSRFISKTKIKTSCSKYIDALQQKGKVIAFRHRYFTAHITQNYTRLVNKYIKHNVKTNCYFSLYSDPNFMCTAIWVYH